MEPRDHEKDSTTAQIIGAAIEVHRLLGPGLLESACQEALCAELSLRGVVFEKEVSLPVDYKGLKLNCAYRLDILLPGKLIIELKAVEALLPVHQAQLLTYMKLSGIVKGLLINFNVPVLKSGLRRLVL